LDLLHCVLFNNTFTANGIAKIIFAVSPQWAISAYSVLYALSREDNNT